MNIKNKKTAALFIFAVSFIIISVFAVITVSAKNNIALDCKIDSFCGESINGAAAMLVDKDPNYNTKWYASDGANHAGKPHWIILDFGADKMIDSIRLVKASQGAEDFGRTEFNASGLRFEISSDKKNWAIIDEVTNDSENDIYEGSFIDAHGRYLKLSVTQPEQNETSNENQAVRLYDLKVFEYISPPTEETTEDMTDTDKSETVLEAPRTSDSALFLICLPIILLSAAFYIITRIFSSPRSRWI